MFTNTERARLLRGAAYIGGYHSVAEWAHAHGVSLSAAQKTAGGVDVGPHTNATVDRFITETIIRCATTVQGRIAQSLLKGMELGVGESDHAA